MFIRGKPIRYEYKICLCGSDGYPYHLSIYTGKSQDTGKPSVGITCCKCNGRYFGK